MKKFSIISVVSILLAVSGIGISFSHAQPEAQSKTDSRAAMLAQISELQQVPDRAGSLVYEGTVFGLNRTGTEPLFKYERRVARTASGHAASHMTSDPSGAVIIVESAEASSDYALQRFDAVNLQTGQAGSVTVSNNGRRLDYHLDDNGRVSTASEDISAPAVSGPQLFGFILKNWDVLKAGNKVPVRMIVLKDLTTYGFDIRFEKQDLGTTMFSVTPSSFFVRMAISPMHLTFDTQRKSVLHYEGRVPPMEMIADKLKDLDARVEYKSNEFAYR